MKKAILILVLMITPAAMAGDFEGTYDLDYSELGLGLNFGVIVGGTVWGADWVLPLETLPEDFFDEFEADLHELIDSNPFIPDEEKEHLKEMVSIFLDEVMEHFNALVAVILEDLPETARVNQGAWPFHGILGVHLDDQEFEWPGLVNLETQEFGLLPLVQVAWQGVGPWGSSAALHVIAADGEFTPEEDRMSGYFLNMGEMALISPAAVVFAGVGVGGAFQGDRSGEPFGDDSLATGLEDWIHRQVGWERIGGLVERELAGAISAAH